jgi:hypothetical protein
LLELERDPVALSFRLTDRESRDFRMAQVARVQVKEQSAGASTRVTGARQCRQAVENLGDVAMAAFLR